MFRDCMGLHAGISADATAPLPSFAITEYNVNTAGYAVRWRTPVSGFGRSRKKLLLHI